jgi:hypothetical protein
VVKKLSGYKLKILSHSNPERDMSKAYSSNLTQWQWELIEPMIPAAKPGGRNRFLTVDTLGLVLSVFVTAASQTEREGGIVLIF